MEYENIIMQLIVDGGNARSKAMEAIDCAKCGDINGAKELISKADDELGKAHKVQTQLIQDEAAGNTKEVTLLMVHAQDHLMNAITVRDLALEFIDVYDKFTKQK